MAHYAFIKDTIVTEVIVGKDEDDTDKLPINFANWEEYYLTKRLDQDDCKRTSYNTHANIHINDGVPFRGNFAGIGFTYDEVNDVFIPTKVYESWILDETSWTWKPPIPKPELTEQQQAEYNYYSWDENTVSWILINSE